MVIFKFINQQNESVKKDFPFEQSSFSQPQRLEKHGLRERVLHD
jgi:hypothetical protein